MAQEVSIKELSDDIRAAIAELKARPEIEQVGCYTKLKAFYPHHVFRQYEEIGW